MKHGIPLIYALWAIAFIVPAACSESTQLPPALHPKVLDCQYHVIERFVEGNEDLIARVLSVPRGEPQVEELVQVLLELGKDSPEIVEAGDQLFRCIPVKPVAPPPDAGNKVLRFEATSSETLASSAGDDCEGQGCCSSHGGECGCFGARVKCCDGSISPSCKCW